MLPHPIWPPRWLKAVAWIVVLSWAAFVGTLLHFIVKFW